MKHLIWTARSQGHRGGGQSLWMREWMREICECGCFFSGGFSNLLLRRHLPKEVVLNVAFCSTLKIRWIFGVVDVLHCTRQLKCGLFSKRKNAHKNLRACNPKLLVQKRCMLWKKSEKWFETATLEPLEVPVEPRSAAVEHVAAPVEPVLAPVDNCSSPWRLQRPCLSPGGLPFLLAALPRYHI